MPTASQVSLKNDSHLGAFMTVHLCVQQGIRSRNQFLRPPYAAEGDFRYPRAEGGGILVQSFDGFASDLILSGHLADHQLGVHDELDLVGPYLEGVCDIGYESSVFRIVVRTDPKVFRILVYDLPVLRTDYGESRRPRVPSGASVGVEYISHR